MRKKINIFGKLICIILIEITRNVIETMKKFRTLTYNQTKSLSDIMLFMN